MSSLDKNLAKRMAVTMDSELDPELVTPMSAGYEEEPDKGDVFPIVKQFKQTNMRGRYSRNTDKRGLSKD
jgi:tRNA A-37 threonylcarbamoyl transferase component Bud32